MAYLHPLSSLHWYVLLLLWSFLPTRISPWKMPLSSVIVYKIPFLINVCITIIPPFHLSYKTVRVPHKILQDDHCKLWCPRLFQLRYFRSDLQHQASRLWLDRHHFYYILGIDSCTIYFDCTPDEYFSTFRSTFACVCKCSDAVSVFYQFF